MTVALIGKYFPLPLRAVLPAIVMAFLTIGIAGLPSTAEASFTCANNDDCAATAAQCDPGRTPCNDGICDPSNPASDGIGCVLIPNDSKCDDGIFCNGPGVCTPGHGCADQVPVNCDDNVACTLDRCDEDLNKCTHAKRNSMCSNGQFCDGVEICSLTGCKPGTPPKCGDNVDCTTDTCDEVNDVCTHVPNNGLCSDGQFCDGVETCTLTGCKPGTPPNCNDNVTCTSDTCDETRDTCSHSSNNSGCDDGLYCNGVETCSPTGCKPGTPPNCNDNVSCTVDSCDESKDMCTHSSSNSGCDDGLFCNGAETCSPTGCKPGTPPSCSDNVDCTVDRCIESNDSCQHTVRDDRCDDGKYCDGVETCNATQGCKPGTPVNCADNVSCTVDKCVEATQTCSHTESNALCNDGLFCNGDERCDYLIGCYPGIAPKCSDNVDCTIDTCIEETDSCAHAASNDRCSNGLFCDGVETCDSVLGCKSGTPPVCSDIFPCTIDACSETSKSCVHAPDNTACSDGLFCDGIETCSPAVGCVPGSGPVCGDGLDCTTDTCAEGTDSCIHVPNGTSCGNGVIDAVCGEECDHDNGEVCNNDRDDDGDGKIDCADTDCSDPVPTCDDFCQIVPPCLPLRNDPAVISWGGTERAAGRPGAFSFHARLLPSTPIDPLSERFVVTLSNDEGQIFRAELKPVDLRSDGSRFRYRASDPDAVARDGGIAKLSIQRRVYSGEVGYAFRVQAFGDFSRATLPVMTTQVYFGDDVGYVTAEWTGEPGHWILRQKDYDDGVP